MLEGIDTLPHYQTGDYPTLGPAIAVWALENGIKVLDGPLQGKPFIPTKLQLNFLAAWYRVYPQGHPLEGEFVYRSGAIRLSRGLFKSPLGAFIAIAELVGPVRFAGWGHRDKYGNLKGSRAPMALVQLSAVSESQVQNSFRYAGEWAAKTTQLAANYGLDSGKTQVYAPAEPGIPGGKLQIVTSSAATIRGSRPTFVLADELSEWTQSNGGMSFWGVMLDNSTKVHGSRILGLMNAHSPGSGSVAEMLHEQYLEEQKLGGESRFLYWAREAHPSTDWSNEDSIRESMEWIYASAPWVSVDQVMATILNPTKPIPSSQKEYGSQIVSDLSSWVSRQGWDNCARPDLFLTDRDAVALFVDPSETDDATALVACRVSDGLVEPLWIHEPAKDGPVDPAELDRQVRIAFDRFRVQGFFADVHPMEQLVRSEWPQRYGDKLPVWASKKDPVAYDMRSFQKDFAQACELAASEIESGELMHTGDSTLTRHVYNTQRRPYREFISVGKGDRNKKIDASVAMIGARMVRRHILAGITETYIPVRIR